VLLDRILDSVGLELRPFGLCDVRESVGVVLPAANEVQMHFVVRGAGIVVHGDGVRQPVRERALVIVPPGMEHGIECEGRVARRLSLGTIGTSDHVATLTAGDGRSQLLFVAAHMRPQNGRAVVLFDQLPCPLVVDLSDIERLTPLFDALVEEQRSREPGSRHMGELIMQQCLLHALRKVASEEPGPLPWLRACRDPGLSRALEAILRTPASPHSLRSLAAAAGMSRTAFTSRFTQAFGRAPMDVVKQVRMGEAIRLLRTTDLPVEEVAAKVGFSSRALFSRELAASLGQGSSWSNAAALQEPRIRTFAASRRRRGDSTRRGSA
jgi:AraC family transcriptional activator of mtrCDE